MISGVSGEYCEAQILWKKVLASAFLLLNWYAFYRKWFEYTQHHFDASVLSSVLQETWKYTVGVRFW